MNFQKQKLASIREKSKTHQWRKIGKQRYPIKTKKQVYTEGASENLMRESPGKLKESGENLNDGKAVQLMVSWIRVDLDSFSSLLFHLRFSWRYCVFENKCWIKSEEKEMKGTSLTIVVLWFSWCAHWRAWLHLLKTKLVRNQLKEKPIPKPTLTFKQIRMLCEVMFPM